MGEFESVAVDEKSMDVFVAKPEPLGVHPAVIITHHRYGIDDFTKDIAGRLATKGYVAAAPNFFHRQHDDVRLEERSAHLKDSEVIADLGAAIAHIERADYVQSGRFAILGHCMGGRMAFLGAEAFPVFKAAVAYYSGNMRISWGDEGATPFDNLDKITCPVIGFFGNDDENPTVADVADIDAALTDHGIAHEFHGYDGAGHAFQNFLSPERYREDAARDSWQRTEAFLREHLL